MLNTVCWIKGFWGRNKNKAKKIWLYYRKKSRIIKEQLFLLKDSSHMVKKDVHAC